METILGLDIGGTKTAILEGTLDADIRQRREIQTQAQDPFEVTLRRICDEANLILQESRQKGRTVTAISVAIGGPLNIERGIILAPPHLPNFVDAPLKTLLQKTYNLPVYVEHDGNAGALAEFTFGAGKGTTNLIFLTAGTGFGGGLIMNGRIYRGSSDLAGEVGHVRLADDGPVEYGKAGSWEGYCSGAGMLKLAHLRKPGRWPDSFTTRDLVKHALAGDADAMAIVHESGSWLGRGLAALIDTLNPDMIVLGSLAAALGDLLLEPAREVIRAECLPQAAALCRIVPAALGARLGDVAALMAAITAIKQDGASNTLAMGSETHSPVQAALEESLRMQSRLAGISSAITETATVLCRALQDGRKVIVFGNGGSASQAQHLAGELVGKYGPVRKSLPCIALPADSGVVTCIANDFGYEKLFSRQVEAFAQPGDVVIGFTTSGKSPNVLRALEAARERGAVTIALTGERGLIGSHADHVVAVPSSNTARIQEGHSFIVHTWCDVIDAAFV